MGGEMGRNSGACEVFLSSTDRGGGTVCPVFFLPFLPVPSALARTAKAHGGTVSLGLSPALQPPTHLVCSHLSPPNCCPLVLYPSLCTPPHPTTCSKCVTQLCPSCSPNPLLAQKFEVNGTQEGRKGMQLSAHQARPPSDCLPVSQC